MNDTSGQDLILQTCALSKSFKGFTAVSNVDLNIRRGAIHALIGPNGAGKTTCFNLLTKFLAPSAGSILFNGIDVTKEKPNRIARRGVVRSFQISAVFAESTALENVRIGLLRQSGLTWQFWRGARAFDRFTARAMDLLDQVGLSAFAHTLAGNLPYGHKRALEIATTLAMEPELMLLDEPTQGMGHEDVSRVTELLRRVGAGRTILLVEHNMNVIASIADTITVLERGVVIAEGSYEQVSRDPRVAVAYMGTADEPLHGPH